MKPLFEKEEIKPERLKPGPGMLLPTALRLAVTESLLPKGTVQLGPRNFIKKKFTDYKNGTGKQKHTRVYIYIISGRGKILNHL